MATSIDNFSDLKELGIDPKANDSLMETFNRAADHLPNLLPRLDEQTLLELYGYYKQGSVGPCNTPKPSWYEMKAKAKWHSWSKLGDMSSDDAKLSYVQKIKELDPDFKCKANWVSVSVPQEERLSTEPGNIFTYVQEGDCEALLRCLKPSVINSFDDDGLGLIHWAADRGFAEIMSILIKHGADVDLKGSDGQTALHYASSCGNVECVKLLLQHEARKDIKDNDGCTPIDVASDVTVQELLA